MLVGLLAPDWRSSPVPEPDPRSAPGPSAPGPSAAPQSVHRAATRPPAEAGAAERGQLPGRAKAGWAFADARAADPALLPAHGATVPDAVLVAVAENLRDWRAGDRVSFTVPQAGATYTSVIERVETGLGPNRSFSGSLIEAGSPYSFVLTAGERNTFANLLTPAGSFELAGNGSFAWLMPTAGMDRHIDHRQPDYVVPELSIDVQ